MREEEIKKHNTNILISLLGPIFVILALVFDYGGNRQELITVEKELAIIREELRTRTRDRIYKNEHKSDIERLDRRIERTETWVFGSDDSGGVVPHVHKE